MVKSTALMDTEHLTASRRNISSCRIGIGAILLFNTPASLKKNHNMRIRMLLQQFQLVLDAFVSDLFALFRSDLPLVWP